MRQPINTPSFVPLWTACRDKKTMAHPLGHRLESHTKNQINRRFPRFSVKPRCYVEGVGVCGIFFGSFLFEKKMNEIVFFAFMKRFILIFILALSGIMPVVAQEEAQPYYTVDEMPDLTNIQPSSPDYSSVSFARDVTQYIWGKAQRLDPERSEMAIADAEYSLNRIISVFSEPFGMPISFDETPETYRLLRDFTVTCDNICKKIKVYYMRKWPFTLFNESTLTPKYEEEMLINGSYPSGHSIFGWCAALILSEINPGNTEALMNRGYKYGESRVIVGAHWQSDVDAGMLAASVLHMKLHTSPAFIEQMAKARKEVQEKTDNLFADRSAFCS